MTISGTPCWYEANGIVAAYQPVAAPNQPSSYRNVGRNRLGINTATLGNAPTWSATVGWTFNGSSQWIGTGITASNEHSMFIRYSGATDSGGEKVICGSTTPRFYIEPSLSNQVAYCHQSYILVAPGLLSGVLAVVGRRGYRNGIVDGSEIGTGSGTYQPDLYIGALFMAAAAWFHCNANVQAFVVYDRILTAGEVWNISKQMAYCEYNPDWNAWAPKRDWWFMGEGDAEAGGPGSMIRAPFWGRR